MYARVEHLIRLDKNLNDATGGDVKPSGSLKIHRHWTTSLEEALMGSRGAGSRGVLNGMLGLIKEQSPAEAPLDRCPMRSSPFREVTVTNSLLASHM